ncbi:MAG: ABC transporter transmembrane domain-containing protein [Nocardioides sp.]
MSSTDQTDTTDTAVPEEQEWRGVAAEHHDDELTDATSGRLQARSRRLLADLIRPHKKLLWIALAIVVVENAARLSIPYLVKEGIDRGIPPIRQDGDTSVLFTIVAIVLGATLLQAATRVVFLNLSGRIGQDMLFEVRRRVFRHFQKRSPAFHDDYTSGRVISRQTSDVDAIYELLETGFDGLVNAVLTLAGTAILLLVLDVKLALVALVSFPFLMWLTNWFRKESAKSYRVTREKVALVIAHFVESMLGIRAVQAFRREPRNQEIFEDVNDQYRRANLRAFRLVALLCFPFLLLLTNWFRKESAKSYRVTREKVALVIVHFVETMNGMRAVQAFRREPRNQEIFDDVNDQYRAANLVAFRLVAWFMPGIRLIGNITIAVVLLYGGYRAYNGDVTVGVLAAFLLYLRQFFEPMMEISQFYNTFQSASAALDKLAGVLAEPPGVPEPVVPRALESPRGEVRFDHVSFSYVDGRPVLPDLELTVPAGQTLALVGTTGAGKTTLAKLATRFYDPDHGRIQLDGVDLRELTTDSLRSAVVMVTQENYLFSGSIADNVRFGRPDASLDDVVRATTALGAHDFIAAMPDGYDTQVANQGGRLSAGQRQLVAFARAFLADPAVLILDEATSSLDIPSERLVQQALRTVLAGRTAVIIAHRLSTVEIADRVLVIEHGRIVEDGTPRELVAGGAGRFSDLHQAWLESLA